MYNSLFCFLFSLILINFSNMVYASTFKVIFNNNDSFFVSSKTKVDVSNTSIFIIEVDKDNLAQNDADAVNEITFYDASNNVIPYTIQVSNSYDSAENGLPYFWNQVSSWGYSNLYDGFDDYSQSDATIFNWGHGTSNYNYTGYTRFALTLSKAGPKSIKMAVPGSDAASLTMTPGEIKLYKLKTGLSINYNTDIASQSNQNLILVWDVKKPNVINSNGNPIYWIYDF